MIPEVSSSLNRRRFLELGIAALPATLSAEGGVKAPFRVLYSNDTTNITSCTSPFHKKGEPFRPAMLEATIDEVAGLVDAHFLQPGLGMVPMWPSKVLPLDAHYAWIKERYGQAPDSFGKYVLGGGDVVKVFVDRCRKTRQAAFISFRLNDAHHKEFADPRPGQKPGSSIGMSVTRHYVDHPEYRFKKASSRGSDLVQNWIHTEVRAQKLALITELCENYDLDGLELDFMRFYSFFDSAATTLEQRCNIITTFVSDVRAVLNRTAPDGRHRWLCARIPCLVRAFDPMGIDLKAMTAAGLDMVNASASYFTTQEMDIEKIRALCSGASLYVELCHSIWNGGKLVPGYDTFTFRRATREQLQTTAHLAYARGADGISLFNFAYYREHGGPGRGPFAEPPFEVLKHLRDANALARTPQHYFLTEGWNNPFVRPPSLPRKIEAGKVTELHLDLAPPAGGWKHDARLRLQFEDAVPPSEWKVTWNSVPLDPSSDISEPFPNPYPPMLGKSNELLAWTLPAGAMRDGHNELRVVLVSGTAPRLVMVDFANKV